ncbi:uncharacterized protein Hap1MRO34_013199 isoform 2-T2 [Clarias gariepinus]|uniref:uncharacterized protein si:dkey-52l18.4 isoform X2 n=1 Tax=Clarias gariepinus TaxID=13013 RepID=UPI00234C9581|nr:uncharacterized protein si:dkey-52l18.4 isoform X2 [Clarias gariepinus]
MLKNLLSGCFFGILTFLSHFQVCVSECLPAVVASRRTLYKPEGGSVSVYCDVQHCAQNWTGGWGISQGHFALLDPSPRVQLSNISVSHTTTRLVLEIHNLNQSDSGPYHCNIKWKESNSQGHVTLINVTASSSNQFIDPASTGRTLSHRLMVCAAASLCFLLALALALCFSYQCRPAPPVPPPRSRNNSTARVKPNVDVVYAVLDRPRQQRTAQQNTPTTGVIYSTLSFSQA